MMNDEMKVIEDNLERLDGMFRKDVLKESLLNYIKFSYRVSVEEKRKWMKSVDEWMSRLKSDKVMFPRCALSVERFLMLMREIGVEFPISLYFRSEDVKVYRKIMNNDEMNSEYENVKCFDCLVEVLRMEGVKGVNIPCIIKLRLLYLPRPGTIMKIIYTGNGFERKIEIIDNRERMNVKLFDSEGRVGFIDRMKFIPFQLLKMICEGVNGVDKMFVNVWCQCVEINI